MVASRSPSESLRKQIPHLRNVLQSRINEANNVLSLQLPHDDQEIGELQEKITACIGLLSSPVIKIKDIDQMWEAELKNLTAENEEEEVKLYVDVAVNLDNGYYRLLYEADGVFCRLRARYSRLQGRRQTGRVGITPSQSAGCVLVPHSCPGAGLVPAFPTSSGQKTSGSPFLTTKTQQSVPMSNAAGPSPVAGAPSNTTGTPSQPDSKGNASAAGESPNSSSQSSDSSVGALTAPASTTHSNRSGHQGYSKRRGGANGGGKRKQNRSRAHHEPKLNHSRRLFSRHSGPGRCGSGGNQSGTGSHGGYPMNPRGPGPTPTPQTSPGGVGVQAGAFGPSQSPQTGPGGFNCQPGGFGGGGPQTSWMSFTC